MLIQPITVRLIAYGAKANVTAIRNRATDLLKDEHGQVDPAWLVPAEATAVHQEILAQRWDTEAVLKKPTPSQEGVIITLERVHERMTTEWLFELPVAKQCVAFATWVSAREPMAWQLLIAQGRHWSESRPT